MYALTGEIGSAAHKSVPNRPAISNVLLKASANAAFRIRLLTNPQDALAEMDLPPEDIEVLSGVATPTLREFARQVEMRLTVDRFLTEKSSN